MKTTNKSSPAYELDFYGWTQEQAKLLQEQKWSQLDIPNLVEEIEALGRQERQELENRLGILLGHLLKWEFQPDNRSRSWFATIREQRRRVERLLKKSPSLQPYLPEALENGYQDALDLAVRETSLSYKTFPSKCPYSLDQILNNHVFPGETFEPEEYS
ncbi:conserved domain protein, putative [Coleofasciculus chthonoplastes PCC 7420]|uniref:Conserved domain protein, putative n=1 Tax=Coleofasciculus chthonoplastes PCC 7420 TaxID=118168 RepID=B4VMG4_9CYAN|nr:DUF29 domain-containing protein [Coleofasciculus chthonoplastes]EDX76794.1 conserved domain protein, putative [Coleofasciculus chthonoplastes PCC 7420]